MSLKLMYITNRPDIALIAEQAGVDRVFIDMEYIGKAIRQKGLDTVQNHHTIADIKNICTVLTKAELIVRVNPIHESTNNYCSSEEEINAVIQAGANVIMLPYFKTVSEVKKFISYVNGRVKTSLLMETPESVALVDEIINIPGVDEIYLGINDMSIGYGKTFMFELLTDGTIEYLCMKFKYAGIPFGFGGIASIGTGKLPAESILKEHYRLGSTMVILSRSFYNINQNTDINYIHEKFEIGIRSIRAFEHEIVTHSQYFKDNEKVIAQCVKQIVDEIKHR